jgi:glycosyltransferase involved in cell wall biosynthesis
MHSILYINYSNELGGAEKSLLDILETLDRTRYRPILLTFGRGRLSSRARDARVEVVEIPDAFALSVFRRERMAFSLIKSLWRIPRFLRQLVQVRQVIQRRTIDIVHTNNPKSHLMGSIASAGLVRHVVFHMRDIFTRGSLSFFLFALLGRWRKPTTIAISAAVMRSLPGALKRNALIVYNGFRLPVIQRPRSKVRRMLGIPDSDKLLVTAGRIVPWKGLDLLLEAMALLVKSVACRLCIVGDVIYWDKDYLPMLRRRARSLSIADRVVFTGFVDDVNSILAAADLCVLPSKNEPFGRTLVEAMLCEVPVAAFRQGGPVEIIDDNRTGLLLDKRDPATLAAAAEYLLRDDEKRRAMGRAARQAAIRRYALSAMQDNLDRLYSRLLGD